MIRDLVLCVLATAGCHADDYLSYTWDDRRVLCSAVVDDITGSPNWGRIQDQFAQAEREGWVTILHAHKPSITISLDAIERIFTLAEQHHLDYVRFDEMTPAGPPRAGLAFAFDDDNVNGWFSLRDMFAAHGARLTFFVTRWVELTTQELDQLETLAADGHDLEPHSVNHVPAIDYVREHGLDAYLADEVLPSFQVMGDAGYHPTTYAFPFGETTPAITDAVLQHIDKVRTTVGACPY